MISLKTRDTQAEATYRRVIGLLLQGIALHAVEGTDADRKRFQEQMDQCNEGFSSGLPVSDLLALVGRVLRAMEDYNRRTGKFVEQQSGELQRMVAVLIETVISIGTVTEKSLSALQEIDKSMGQAKAQEDLRVLRLRLAECLGAVREETARQTRDRQSALLTGSSEAGSEGSVARAVRDAATGLLNAEVAGEAIRTAVESPEGKYLLIAVLSHVQAINARFGYALGDRILADFAQHFSKGISNSDRIFRWKGPALLAVLDRPGRVDTVRAEVRRFADTKLERTMEVGQRTIHISTSATWSLMQVAAPIEALMQQVDAFTAAQLPRDYA